MELYQKLLKITSLYAHTMTVDLAMLRAIRDIDEELYLQVSYSYHSTPELLTMFLNHHNISLDKRRQ